MAKKKRRDRRKDGLALVSLGSFVSACGDKLRLTGTLPDRAVLVERIARQLNEADPDGHVWTVTVEAPRVPGGE